MKAVEKIMNVFEPSFLKDGKEARILAMLW